MQGLWKYRKKLPMLPCGDMLSLGEGNTPLSQAEGIYFKHEYSNPSGSAKDRGTAMAVSRMKNLKINKAVISSSGNAAISASLYCANFGIDLKVFVSNRINRKKLKELIARGVIPVKDKRPLSLAADYANSNIAYNMRGSLDDFSFWGYAAIAYEILDNRMGKFIDACFVPVSSGTIFSGIAAGFAREKKREISMHVVQTTQNDYFSRRFDKVVRENKDARSIADAITAKHSAREKEMDTIIKNTKGFAWTVPDNDIKKADSWLRDRGIETSYEGALALAGFFKAQSKGWKYNNPLVILTGKKYH